MVAKAIHLLQDGILGRTHNLTDWHRIRFPHQGCLGGGEFQAGAFLSYIWPAIWQRPYISLRMPATLSICRNITSEVSRSDGLHFVQKGYPQHDMHLRRPLHRPTLRPGELHCSVSAIGNLLQGSSQADYLDLGQISPFSVLLAIPYDLFTDKPIIWSAMDWSDTICA